MNNIFDNFNRDSVKGRNDIFYKCDIVHDCSFKPYNNYIDHDIHYKLEIIRCEHVKADTRQDYQLQDHVANDA